MKTGLLEVVNRGIGKLEHLVRWKSWGSGRNCEKDLHGKSEMLGDTV